jgi:hypothetical protein
MAKKSINVGLTDERVYVCWHPKQHNINQIIKFQLGEQVRLDPRSTNGGQRSCLKHHSMAPITVYSTYHGTKKKIPKIQGVNLYPSM